jgi:putative endonuclease
VPNRRQRLGAAGEAAVARRYEREGYQVLERNWRCREGEIDLIVRRARLLVFCEVKTRRTDAYGTPAEAVTEGKRRKVRQVARRYLENCPVRFAEIRFDVGAVTPTSLEILEAAF